jgi:hypothetical protein
VLFFALLSFLLKEKIKWTVFLDKIAQIKEKLSIFSVSFEEVIKYQCILFFVPTK